VDENAPEVLNATYLNAAGSTNWAMPPQAPVTTTTPQKGSTVASFPTPAKQQR